jgi:hypothetical protein
VAYEAQAAFLMNAVMAGTHSIDRNSNGKDLFWRTSASEKVPTKLVSQYIAYARERGTDFMRQLDDWFGQHERESIPSSKFKAAPVIGIGFFPYIQNQRVGRDHVPERLPKARASKRRNRTSTPTTA